MEESGSRARAGRRHREEGRCEEEKGTRSQRDDDDDRARYEGYCYCQIPFAATCSLSTVSDTGGLDREMRDSVVVQPSLVKNESKYQPDDYQAKFQSKEVVNFAVFTRQCEGNDPANDKKDKVRRAAGFFWTDTCTTNTGQMTARFVSVRLEQQCNRPIPSKRCLGNDKALPTQVVVPLSQGLLIMMMEGESNRLAPE